MNSLKCALAMGLVVLLATTGYAAVIPLTNAGFEDAEAGAWVTSAWGEGREDFSSLAPPVGPQAGHYLFSLLYKKNDQVDTPVNSLSQATEHVIAAGETYTLTYYVAPKHIAYVVNPDFLVQVTAQLYDVDTGNPLVSSSGEPASLVTTKEVIRSLWLAGDPRGTDDVFVHTDDWVLQTLTFTVPEGSTSIGNRLGIVFHPSDAPLGWACQTALDSISLSVESASPVVPEPSAMLLLGSGAVGAMVYGWRKRR